MNTCTWIESMEGRRMMSLSGGGYNEISMDDTSGAEKVRLRNQVTTLSIDLGRPAAMPETGDEVVIGFEEGDPDQPVILAAVPT
jgi:uncharacterized protein involved in type VI secretion and phage assembly